MKNQPKRNEIKILSILLISVFSLTVSCKKDKIAYDQEISIHAPNSVSVTPDMPPPGGNGSGMGTPIVRGADGIFRAAYGGLNLNFGTNVFWPTVVQTWENGNVFDGISDIFDDGNVILSYNIVDGRFAIFLSSMGSYPSQEIFNYNKAFVDFVQQKRDPQTNELIQHTLPQPKPIGEVTPNVITGQFIIDTASPTNLSISAVTINNQALQPVN